MKTAGGDCLNVGWQDAVRHANRLPSRLIGWVDKCDLGKKAEFGYEPLHRESE